MTTKAQCPNIHDDERTYLNTGFGFAIAKIEGAPEHPDTYTWEHPPGSGCVKCQRNYDKALKRYNDYYCL